MYLDLILSYLNEADSAVCRLGLNLFELATPETLIHHYINTDDVIGVRNVLELFPARWDAKDLINAVYSARCTNIIQNCMYVNIQRMDIIRYVVQLRHIRMLQWLINTDMVAPDQMIEIQHRDKHLAGAVHYPPVFELV